MGDGDRIDAAGLVGLVRGWSDGDGPLYRQLADALARLILGGEVPAGVRLPAERALADALPAARGTVVAALRVLTSDGLVERRQGSGTTVAPRPGDRARRSIPAAGLRAQSLTGRAIGG
ncbi:MAG: GntR family transcriptional regulator, partial [Acidimicrobiales bacterium]